VKGTPEDLAHRYGAPKQILCRLPSIAFPPISERKHGEVCMAILRPNRRFLFQTKRSYPNAVMRLPSGGIKSGEILEHALMREVWEETNLTVTIDRFVAVLRYTDENDKSAFQTNLFFLRELDGELQVNDPSEQISGWHEVAPEKLADYAKALESMQPSWNSWGYFRAAAVDALAEHCLTAVL
jgi:8-oxo-dGTP diphosphatase